MNARETRLRIRVDKLRDERDTLKEMLTLRGRKIYKLCPWCGTPCYGPACTLHRDVEDIVAGRLM